MKYLKIQDVIETGSIQPISFTWFISNKCQFDCSYCSSKPMLQDNKSKKDIPKYIILLILKKLSKLNKDFIIELSGGETTLQPMFNTIVKTLSALKHCIGIKIFTNGLDNEKILELEHNDKIEIIASFHNEYANTLIVRLDELIRINNKFKFKININLNDLSESDIANVKIFQHNNINIINNYLESSNFYKTKFPNDIFEQKEFLTSEFKTKTETYILTIDDIEKLKLKSFKGDFKCQKNSYNIDIKGRITNECVTTNNLPVDIEQLNSIPEFKICKNDFCPCTRLMELKKIRL